MTATAKWGPKNAAAPETGEAASSEDNPEALELEEAASAYENYAAGLSEVEIDTLTGETVVLRTDIIYDCGRSSHQRDCRPCVTLIDDSPSTSL